MNPLQMSAQPKFARAERILWDVVEEHLDEASFLWGQWERALVSPQYTVQEVAARVEPRMLAHLDGLVVGGAPVAERLLVPALHSGTTGEAFAAAYALVDSGSAAPIQLVCDQLGVAKDGPRAGIQRALALLPRPEVALLLRRQLGSEHAAVRAAALAILAFQRVDMSSELATLLQDPEPVVVGAALRAVGALAASNHAQFVRYFLNSADKQVGAAAVIAGAILGIREVWPRCRALATDPTAPYGSALLLLALAGDPADQRLVLEAAAAPDRQRAALFALGFSGTIDAADACVQLMQDPDRAALAGEAFAALTGVNFAEEKLLAAVAAEPEAEPDAAAEADPESALGVSAADELTIPDGAAVAAWWQRHRESLRTQPAFSYGRPADPRSLLALLERAPMRRRHALALDLAIRTRGTIQLTTRGLARDQLIELAPLLAR